MRIVLNQERKEYVIIESVPNEPGTNPPRASKDKFEKHMDDMLNVGCLVLATITLELQKQHEYVLLRMLRTAESNLKTNGSNSIQIVRVAKERERKVGMGIFILYAIKPKTLKGSRNSRMKYRINKARILKTLRSDRVREYLSLDELLEECGIVSQLTRHGGMEFLRGEIELCWTCGKGRNIELEEVQQQQLIKPEVEGISQAVEENPTDLETQPLRRSTRERHEPERYGFLVTTHGYVILVDQDEPKTYQEAVASPDSEKWLEAMRSEMDFMSENQVWTLVEPPKGIKPIGCKWVFKKKTDMDGNVQTYKGRLVAKGFQQIHGVDYDETFSPVAMFKSIRILLAVAAFHDYEIWQMDVKTAFLNGKLEEDVYMTQPEGFVTLENVRKVCKLQRSIYGLKQASRSWNLCFNEAIQEFGFIRNEDEPCVYKKFSGSIVSFLILYVDDILIIGNDVPTLQSIKTWLSSCFSMKDLGEEAYILGVKIYRDRSRRLLGLSQSTYIDKVLKRFSMEESKRGFLRMRHDISLSKEMCPSTAQERANESNPICFGYWINHENPGEGHWTAVKNILKYLRRTKDVFLVYGGEEELRIKGYTDASFQTDKDDSRSQSGFVFCLNGGAISWKSSKQDTVADSTTDAEYIAASEAAKEAVWIKKFITGLGVILSISDAVDLYCDNNGAIAQAKEPRSHQRSKHILRRFHLIREIIDRGDVEMCKVHTDDNIADPLTKPLAQQKHDRHTESLGIRYVSDWS
ncbi:hypothetical protein V6N11_064771 [Hibiscus sabdariffa]|uniref:Reverse transcriptase Ty1/copia-type domain-containing protein n=1 Tax=Hibiscus sabdariffa TaxID=183260 RepID=A0ABR2SI18_9ROSI